jgi:hypothetical protein
MSDLSDLHGVFPTALRWNAEDGFLGISVFNSETGARELEEIELGKPATFALDLATRERGYGLIKSGIYDMKLTPVGCPTPTWPGDPEYKPAVGMWAWHPSLGEVRIETNGVIFRQAITNVWDKARFEPQATEGLQPVVCFTNRVPVPIKAVGKTFSGPIIQIIGWIKRDEVPGWSERKPTVAAPKTLPALPVSAAPTPVASTPTKKARLTKGEPKAKPKTKVQGGDPDDGIDDILGDDPIPYA